MGFQILSFLFFAAIFINLRSLYKIISHKMKSDDLLANSKDVNFFIVSLVVVILFAFALYRAAAGL